MRSVCVGSPGAHNRRGRVTGEGMRVGWDEWEQLKAGAAERHATAMQINGLQRGDGSGGSTGGGGGTGTLKHKGGPWTKAAGTADGLQTSTITAKADLRRAHDGTAGGLAGLASLGALTSVLTSWEERLGRVRAGAVRWSRNSARWPWSSPKWTPRWGTARRRSRYRARGGASRP